MSTPWINVAGFKLRSAMPAEDVDRLEAQYPGFLAAQLADEQAYIEDRLRKRYAVPFVAPYPTILVRWLVRLVTATAYERRGWNPSGMENERIGKAADDARAELKEAADSNEGLFDLPLRADAVGTGISQGGPYGYAEASPYVWTDRQRSAAEGWK